MQAALYNRAFHECEGQFCLVLPLNWVSHEAYLQCYFFFFLFMLYFFDKIRMVKKKREKNILRSLMHFLLISVSQFIINFSFWFVNIISLSKNVHFFCKHYRLVKKCPLKTLQPFPGKLVNQTSTPSTVRNWKYLLEWFLVFNPLFCPPSLSCQSP